MLALSHLVPLVAVFQRLGEGRATNALRSGKSVEGPDMNRANSSNGRWIHWLGYLSCALVFAGLGLVLGRTDAGEAVRQSGRRAALRAAASVARRADVETRMLVLLENPELMDAVSRGGAFGGDFSRHVAQNMFDRDHRPAVDDAKRITRVEELAPRSWLIHLPIVNSVLFETDAGLVVVDTGMAPGGPALLDAIRSVSDAPIHTIVYTHGHVDHAYGTWALVADGSKPEIVAHASLPARFERYIRLRGSIAKYMSQPVEQMPAGRDDLVWPTRTFEDRLELEIGGETFVLQHRRGETDDHLYVWVPGRRILASADFYQGFLPNAGNGKRVQRYVEEWAQAMREMAALRPEIVLPAHGAALDDPATIQENFGVLAETLEYVVQHTVEGLNRGLRKDEISRSVRLPERLARHPSMNVQYVSARDISKMVIRQYTGWWDDFPSHWSPSDAELRAAQIVELAGGIGALVSATRQTLGEDVQLACHLADWAWLASPDEPAVQQLVLDVYKARILDPRSNTQEMLTYLDAMTAARQRQLDAGG